MLDEKKLKEAEGRVKQMISEGIIKSKVKPEYADFFIKNADDSVDSAKALFELSTNSKSFRPFTISKSSMKLFSFMTFNMLSLVLEWGTLTFC